MNNGHAVEILSVGTELLLGGTTNTDARDISEMLTTIGINVFHHTVVGDNLERLKQAMEIAMRRADIIITTGGLGPTSDDLTKNVIADALGLPLVYHPEEEERLRTYIERRHREITPNMFQQAYLPEGCTRFVNDWGTAPGCAVEKDGLTVIMLPGPPKECRKMMEYRVLPYLAGKSGGTIVSHNYKIFGMGEAEMEQILRPMMNAAVNPTIAPYAKSCECLVRITAKANTVEEAEAMIASAAQAVRQELGDMIYGVDLNGLDECVLRLLLEKGMTLSAAESCTGGLIANRITDYPGASKVFLGGVVSYTNGVKEKILGVNPGTIETYNVVSEPVAKEMCENVRRLTGSDLAVSVTGLAGPEGDGIHPVGTVCLGLATPEGTITDTLNVPGRDRENVREYASQHAFDMVRRYLTGLPVKSRTII